MLAGLGIFFGYPVSVELVKALLPYDYIYFHITTHILFILIILLPYM
jgi:hypothetical protein